MGSSASDPHRLSVSPTTLRAHLEVISKRARGTRLGDLLRGLRTGNVPPGAVVLTFDDAYAETLDVLQTVLEEYELPASVFVPTGLLGREPWWNRLHRVLTSDARLPPRLELQGGAFRLARTLREEERSFGAPTVRDGLVLEVYDFFRRLPAPTRDDLLDDVEAWALADAGAAPQRGAWVASSEEIARLARNGLFEIGSHSVSHPFLAGLAEPEQRTEVYGSKSVLEELLGRSVDLFSYPNGSWSRATVDLVGRAGYLGACASHPDVAGRWSDPYVLPRMWPTDDPDAVGRALRVWLG